MTEDSHSEKRSVTVTAFDEPAPIVTFYSYKGGVGRSMAVLNIASLLAAGGLRVLIIDFDLEAPGLSHLIGKAPIPGRSIGGKKKAPGSVKGVVDLLRDAVENGSRSDLFSNAFSTRLKTYTFPYRLPDGLNAGAGGGLSIMPAGILDEGYSSRLDGLDLAGLYRASGNPGKKLILFLRSALRNCGQYDYILIDSRTGHSEEAGICTRDLADHRVFISGLNTQNISGVASFLRSLRTALEAEKSAGKMGSIRDPDIVLSPVPNGEDDIVKEREDAARREFAEAWGKILPVELFIPYHPRLALTEEAYVTAVTASPLRSSYLAIKERLLRSLGHDEDSLLRAFSNAIREANGQRMLFTLRRLVRLWPSSPKTASTLHSVLLFDDDDSVKKIAGMEQGPDIIRELVALIDDKNILFHIARIFYGVNPAFEEFLCGILFGLADVDPRIIGSYADFLGRRGSSKEANEFYLRALEVDPKHVEVISNYAVFLARRGENGSAESYYLRALELDPDYAIALANYAAFLDKLRKFDQSEKYHLRALEVESEHAGILGNYAVFLEKRGKSDEADLYYRRALELDPQHANNLGNYAVLLEARGEFDQAETYFLRALDVNPKHPNNLGNYGQHLLNDGRIEEGMSYLRSAWAMVDKSELLTVAEISLCLWLGSRLMKAEEIRWEGVFKFAILRGFVRFPWSFDRMLSLVEEILKPEEFKYAKALTVAFLDESQVLNLEEFPRWRNLQPLEP